MNGISTELSQNDLMPKRKSFRLYHDIHTQSELRLMLLPATLLMLIFSIIPLFGIVIAFKEYDPISGVAGIFTSPWNNFRNFKIVFSNYDFWPMMRNTVGINLLSNLVGVPFTLLFALLLNEVFSIKLKSVIQTVTYLPHFLSWVIYGGLWITLLSGDDGLVNTILQNFHLISKPIQFLADPNYFWGIAAITSLLKDLGWGTILYLSAIAGVDISLYEAATIDGAGRFKKMYYVTIPSIMPTIMILIIFAISGMLNNNFTQIYVLQNSLNVSMSEVLDTYVYKTGLQQLQFGMATAVSLTKSVLAVLLLGGANSLSKRLTNAGLF